MRAVNPPTQMLLQYLEHCREHSDGVFNDPATHPYFLAIAVAKDIGMDTTTEDYKERTIRTMARWSDMMTNQIVTVSIKEIAEAGKFAQGSKNKTGEKISADLLDSMPLIAAVFKSWQAAIDHEHIAEWMWEDGEKLRANGQSPDVSAHIVEVETKNLHQLMEFLKKKVIEFAEQAKRDEGAKAPACEDEKDEPSSKPPVTPADIMKMLFEQAKKPSSN